MLTNIKNNNLQLENTYLKLPADLFTFQNPISVVNPEIVCFNESLASDLGIGFLNNEKEKVSDYFSGNKIPDGAKPLAQAYAGHQFGHFTMLGDGRAILLGELVDNANKRFDVQLKGSGRTPYSRGGDGRATKYSMLREYLLSEAMYHLGISTTRSLSVISTGEQVMREKVHGGAVLARIAASHLRVGTFEYVRNFCSLEDLQELTNYTLKRHFPELENTDNPALELLKAVMDKQIDLIVDWMRVGFIHGVMNTDNVSIAGETIDYGPCAFMNSYDPSTVFSSIDSGGRYAFGNQPSIVGWNITALGNALLPMISKDPEKAKDLAMDVIEGFQNKFSQKWYSMMFAKLGILHSGNLNSENKDVKLVDELLHLMQINEVDYTQLFLALQQDIELDSPLFKQEEFKAWLKKWKSDHFGDEQKVQALELMNKSNPKVIPRNHLVEEALQSADEGDMNPFNKLLDLLSKPYDDHPDEDKFEQVPKGYDAGYQTYCGT